MLNIKIPEEPNWIVNKLISSGYESYVVGGCVRDSILRKTPKDWDICTNASPSEIKCVFSGSKIVDTGLKHGTITIVLDSDACEVTTYRIDGKYSDGRHPDNVEFTNILKEDLSRRDLTINSMAYNNNAGLIDYFGGESDLATGTIKCVGNPNDRFNEDALRILRAIRFASVLGFNIEASTSNSIFGNYKLLSAVSSERISSEFSKWICGDFSAKTLREYQDIVCYIIPEISSMIGFQQNNPYHDYDVWEHTLHALENSTGELGVRLAILFHDIGKPKSYVCVDGIGHFYGHALYSKEIVEEVLKRMKFDNKTIDNVSLLVYNHDVEITDTTRSVKKVLNKVGCLFEKLMEVKYADTLGQSKMAIDEKLKTFDSIRIIYQTIMEQNSCFRLKDLAINGKDLLLAGYSEGKQVGNVLNSLLELVIDGTVKNDRQELLDAIKDLK